MALQKASEIITLFILRQTKMFKKENKGFIFITLMVYLLSFLYTTNGHSTVLFEADFEDGTVPYLGSGNPHPGGGYIFWLGGKTSGPAGDGTQNPNEYHNVILDNSADAQNSVAGSGYALKTQYRAGNAYSFQKNTTIILFPETSVVYIRWYQKWSRDWVWPTDQQKLCKILKHGEWTQNFKVGGGHNYIGLTHISPGQSFPPRYYETYVYSRFAGRRTNYRQSDSINNGVGIAGADGNFGLDTNRWYCIEVMVKANTPGELDAEYKYWIDGRLVFGLYNTDARSQYTTGVNTVELQHVYQLLGGGHTTVDMPTWMDNIVISTEYIGPIDSNLYRHRVTGVNSELTSSSIKLTWQNPTENDFGGVKILRKVDGDPNGYNDSRSGVEVVYQGRNTSFTDNNLTEGKKYHYAFYTYNSGNANTRKYSSQIIKRVKFAKPSPPTS